MVLPFYFIYRLVTIPGRLGLRKAGGIRIPRATFADSGLGGPDRRQTLKSENEVFARSKASGYSAKSPERAAV